MLWTVHLRPSSLLQVEIPAIAEGGSHGYNDGLSALRGSESRRPARLHPGRTPCTLPDCAASRLWHQEVCPSQAYPSTTFPYVQPLNSCLLSFPRSDPAREQALREPSPSSSKLHPVRSNLLLAHWSHCILVSPRRAHGRTLVSNVREVADSRRTGPSTLTGGELPGLWSTGSPIQRNPQKTSTRLQPRWSNPHLEARELQTRPRAGRSYTLIPHRKGSSSTVYVPAAGCHRTEATTLAHQVIGKRIPQVNPEAEKQIRIQLKLQLQVEIMAIEQLHVTMSHRPCKDPTQFHLNKSSGRYSAWVRRPSDGNKRHYIGCFTTFHMAARAQDRALLKINAKSLVNFKPSDYEDDAELRATLSETAFLKMLQDESRPKYNVVKKSLCYDKFKRMEDCIEELRQVTQLTIRDFVAHLATHPSPSPEVNEAAEALLELFGSLTAGDEVKPVTVGSSSSSSSTKLIENVLALDIPKEKRSPSTSRLRGGGVSSSEDAARRPQTREYCKRKLQMSPLCSYRRPRS